MARAYAEFCGTLVIDSGDARPRPRGRGHRRARGRGRHADDRRPGRGRAGPPHARRRRLIRGRAHDHPGRGDPRGPPGDALGDLIATAAAARTPRSPIATASSSPRRSSRRPRAGSCRSTTSDLDARPRARRAESVRILRRRGDLIISETAPRLRVRERGHRPLERRRGLRRAAARRQRPLRAPDPQRRSAPRPASTSRSSSPTRSAAPGGTGSPTSRSASPGSPRSSTCAVETDARGRELHVTEVALADEVASAAELVMGKAAGDPGRDRARPRARVVPRRLASASSSARRRTTCSGERSSRERPGVPRGAAVDPGVHRRAGRPRRRSTRSWRRRASRRPRTTRGRGGSSWSTPPSAKQDLADRHGRARGGPISRATAWRRPGSTSWSSASHRKLTDAPALVLGCLTWDGLDRYPDDDAPAGRVGHGAALARRRGREPHARRRRRTAWRRAGSRRRSSAPRPRATRWRCPPSGSRTPWCSSAIPTRATSGRRRPPVPLDQLRAFR